MGNCRAIIGPFIKALVGRYGIVNKTISKTISGTVGGTINKTVRRTVSRTAIELQ